MAKVTEIMAAIRNTIRTVDGLRRVPDQPPDRLTSDPIAVVYNQTGSWKHQSHYGAEQPTIDGKHVIAVQVSVPRRDLARDMERLEPFLESIPQAIFAAFYTDEIGGTVVLLNEVAVSLLSGDQQQGGEVGYVFSVDVDCEQEVILPPEEAP